MRQYKATKVLSWRCNLQPNNLDVEVWLENQPALDSWRMYTEVTDIKNEDKIVIDWVSYIVAWYKCYRWVYKNNNTVLLRKEYE